MANLNEYKIEIKNDEDLAKWKSTWIPGQQIPKSVMDYTMAVVMPRINNTFIEMNRRIERIKR